MRKFKFTKLIISVFLIFLGFFLIAPRVQAETGTWIYYDDGTPETHLGNPGATVRFTPLFSPAKIERLKFYVMYPRMSNLDFEVHILDVNRNDLISPLYLWAGRREGWVEIDLTSYGIVINSDFYVMVKAGGAWYLGYDITSPSSGRSYWIDPRLGWGLRLPGNILIRAKITPAATPFSSLSAKVEEEITPDIAENKLEAKGNFILGQGSNGINPVNEPVIIKIGDFEITIPSGSFKWFEHPKKPEKNGWKFEGAIEEIPTEMKIKPLGESEYEFKFETEGLNLCWINDPIKVKLNVGDDFGEIEVAPEIEGLENWSSACSSEIPSGLPSEGFD